MRKLMVLDVMELRGNNPLSYLRRRGGRRMRRMQEAGEDGDTSLVSPVPVRALPLISTICGV